MKSPCRVASRRAIVTHLPEVTRVILIHHNSVMVLTTSHTATRRVLAVLADAAVTGGNVTALLAVLVQLGIAGKQTNVAQSVDRSLTEDAISRRKHSLPSILHHRSGRPPPRRVASHIAIRGCDPHVWKTPKTRIWCERSAVRCPSTITRSPPRPSGGDRLSRSIRSHSARAGSSRTYSRRHACAS